MVGGGNDPRFMRRIVSFTSSWPETIWASHFPLLRGTHLVVSVCLTSAATTVLPEPTSPTNAIVSLPSYSSLVSRMSRSTSDASYSAPSACCSDVDTAVGPKISI